MVTNQQVRILMKAVKTEKTLELAAAKAGMDEKTARKHRRSGRLRFLQLRRFLLLERAGRRSRHAQPSAPQERPDAIETAGQKRPACRLA